MTSPATTLAETTGPRFWPIAAGSLQTVQTRIPRSTS